MEKIMEVQKGARNLSEIQKQNTIIADITGRKFGRLTALYPTTYRDRQRSVIWHCRCDCGNETDISYNKLCYTKVQSCGCIRKECNKKLKDYLIHVDGTSVDILKSKKTPSNNTTGCRGVYWIRGRYVAKIVFQKKAYYLGTYDKYEDAVQARKEAEEILFDGVAAFYDRWKQRADADAKWAEKNPVKIQVNKGIDGKLEIIYIPQI